MNVQRFAVLIAFTMGCTGTEEPLGTPALFPTDYAKTYVPMRDCKLSLEHSAQIRILVAPDAVEAYGRSAEFAPGSIVLKEQYAYRDVGCTGEIEQYTVMRKLPVGSAPDTLDWEWQEVRKNLHEQDTNVESCVSCHSTCGKSPMGYDWTCDELPE
jgi:hypothetical protein